MIFTSPYADADIPDVPLTSFVFQKAEENSKRIALVNGATGEKWSYAQLVAAVRRTASGLYAHGCRKGDVVGLFCPNVPEFAIAFHGVASIGGIVTTANPTYTARELGLQLVKSGARFLICHGAHWEVAQQAAAEAEIKEVFVIGSGPDGTPFEDLMISEGAPVDVSIDPRQDVVALPFSSGTSGLPKGVKLSHYNLVSNICQTAGVEPISARDTLVGVLPFFHIYGLLMILNAGLFHGATIVTMERYDLAEFLKVLERYSVTTAYLVPPIVLALAKDPIVDEYDLGSLKVVSSGAAPLGEEIARQVSQRLGCLVKQGYGLTETSPVTHGQPAEASKIKPGSIGPPLRSTECKVIDLESKEALGPNQSGEILIRGPQVMLGYLNDASASAEMIDTDGWLHTGDVGHADEDGYFYIEDRVKELIKYKGYQVAPAELEAILLAHPEIADAAVIRSPDEEAGEVPKAFVVRAGELSADEIMAWVADQVAPYKRVRKVEFIDRIPKSASGKILRRELVAREYQSGI